MSLSNRCRAPMPQRVFTFPEISDEDIRWACATLRLPATAFSGLDGRDPRLSVLKAARTIDVAACPGSGKTTLLVAKLAILARRWVSAGQGICVLSHTNVARREIEDSLGTLAEGRRLLGYPHYVGTIHGFINTHIAIPWLRSQGLEVRYVDDDASCRRRWWKLNAEQRRSLDRNHHGPSALKIVAPDFDVGDIRWARGHLGRGRDLYTAIKAACRSSMEEGFFCHQEMFVWAHHALDSAPDLAASIRHRFPVLFIDEVQDNSEAQSRLLHRVFVDGAGATIRQRFGDMNQAIFGANDDPEAARTDPFPDPDNTMSISNSYRFGQIIADLANPLGATPPQLVGLGPSGAVRANPAAHPTIFLFDPDAVARVLPSYARYLAEVFTEVDLKSGSFTAVGAVHKERGDGNVPSTVGHYWSEYDHQFSPFEPRPQRFLQYVAHGSAAMAANGDTRHVVLNLADGMIRLARILEPALRLQSRRNRHRQILQLLENHPEVRRVYLRLASALSEGRLPTSAEEWRRWQPHIIQIAAALSGSESRNHEAFLDWDAAAPPMVAGATTPHHGNIYYDPAVAPEVRVRVGSIHSVKGETHTATLVLETFFHRHHLARLKPWLLGARAGQGLEHHNSIISSGLRQHFVAMTRPTHLICMAMRSDHLDDKDVAALQDRNWRIARI
ncbi:UvrD-helicase domain-containing protein [Bosea sp. 685]|uniref:UvrD-helicase domain-containing protein n=1 Tax=Bosea sp. 685 TaxID=3080057 RepID=UPI00289356FC|nr:UvrD-helicase domain-containing protein [Bosea sp. 685]WNJ87962.1 UvrD-helicase domain-containing protein [Bosea sp. 685]